MNNEFAPRRNISERYALTDEQRKNVEKDIKLKDELIQKYLYKGYTQQQAETMAYRVMYIPGFSGPTFND